MTLNMRAAYEALQAMLAEEGHPGAYTTIRLDLDNFHVDGVKVRFSASLLVSSDRALCVIDQPTPEAAIQALRAEIQRHREVTERATTPSTPIEATEDVVA